MYKPINLISFHNVCRDLTEEERNNYLKSFGISLKKHEFSNFLKFAFVISQIDTKLVTENQILNYFYVGYTIPQINKEFDLLKFGENYNINIEIKSKSTVEKIESQLKKNHYYLNILETKTYYFAYVAETDEFYQFDNNTLQLVKIDVIFKLLYEQIVNHVLDLDTCFDPTCFLVSPFNETEKFINKQYFLTDDQKNKKKAILDSIEKKEYSFFSVSGGAGTGKTLLVYDIASDFLNKRKKVLIIHCGYLNKGHDLLNNEYDWDIISAKDINKSHGKISNADLIIIDETQRIYKEQLNYLIEGTSANQACIFSFDPAQCLHTVEIDRAIPEYIQKKVRIANYKLTNKIRTNKEIAAFIKNLMNKNKKSPLQSYKNVEIEYFSDYNLANMNSFLENEIKQHGWKFINYTASQHTPEHFDSLKFDKEPDNAHTVIGQEFDKVIMLINDAFEYNDKGRLITKKRSYYSGVKMLLQIITRTRKKLKIIIVANKSVLLNCVEILNQNNDQ